MSRCATPALLTLALLAGCQQSPDPAQLKAVAQYYLDEGGLALHREHAYGRPCLKPINLQQTLIGGAFAWPGKVVDLVEKHKFARVERQQRPSSYVTTKLTPLAPYKANWLGQGDTRSYCFGKLQLLKVEPVADAEAITAGADQPYLIPGTEALSARITFKLTDIPAGDFAQDVDADHTVLLPGSMLPADYGRELTVIAVLPEKIENYQAQR